MKLDPLLCCSLTLLLSSTVALASPVLITGTPADDLLSTPSSASPNLGGIKINFDSLTPFTTYASTYSSQGITISSPDGLEVLPYSTQSGPNELYDTSAEGSADLTIDFAGGTNAIGVGIADSDAVTIYLQALNSSGALFGTQFSITIPENTENAGNGYYVIEDTTPDIYGLLITQPLSSLDYSGLAIDDVQVAPEPSSFLLLAAGVTVLCSFRLRKRA